MVKENNLIVDESQINIIKKDIDNRLSRASRVKSFFNKFEKWKRHTYETTSFKEPVLMLKRRSGDVEFYEDATAGIFEFKHSSGDERFLLLTPNKQLKFGFADRMFRGYICDEDIPLPLPQNPQTTVEQMNIAYEKIMNDIKTWKAKEVNAYGNMWWNIFTGLGWVVVACGFVWMLVGK